MKKPIVILSLLALIPLQSYATSYTTCTGTGINNQTRYGGTALAIEAIRAAAKKAFNKSCKEPGATVDSSNTVNNNTTSVKVTVKNGAACNAQTYTYSCVSQAGIENKNIKVPVPGPLN